MQWYTYRAVHCDHRPCHKSAASSVYFRRQHPAASLKLMNLHLFFSLPVPGAALWPGLAAVDVYTMSPGRIGAIIAGLLALTGLLVGGQALRRQKTGAGTGRRGAVVALVAGLVAIVLGATVVVTSAGGL